MKLAQFSLVACHFPSPRVSTAPWQFSLMLGGEYEKCSKIEKAKTLTVFNEQFLNLSTLHEPGRVQEESLEKGWRRLRTKRRGMKNLNISVVERNSENVLFMPRNGLEYRRRVPGLYGLSVLPRVIRRCGMRIEIQSQSQSEGEFKGVWAWPNKESVDKADFSGFIWCMT